jgi:hypothetical protein
MKILALAALLSLSLACAKPKPDVELPAKNLSAFTIVPPAGAKLTAKNDDRAELESGDIHVQIDKPKAADRGTIAAMKAASEKKPTFKGWIVDEPHTLVGENPEGRFGIMSIVEIGDANIVCSGRLEGAGATKERAKELYTICRSIKPK